MEPNKSDSVNIASADSYQGKPLPVHVYSLRYPIEMGKQKLASVSDNEE